MFIIYVWKEYLYVWIRDIYELGWRLKFLLNNVNPLEGFDSATRVQTFVVGYYLSCAVSDPKIAAQKSSPTNYERESGVHNRPGVDFNFYLSGCRAPCHFRANNRKPKWDGQSKAVQKLCFHVQVPCREIINSSWYRCHVLVRYTI